MKYKDKKVARMILKKTTRYLKNAIVMFVCTMIALCFGILFMISYIEEQNSNFEDNDNVHMIKVEGRLLEEEYKILETGDYTELNKLVSGCTNEYANIPFYYIPQVHMIDKDDEEPINLIAVNKEKGYLLCREEMKDMTAYTSAIAGKKIDLSVPVYEEQQDGV